MKNTPHILIARSLVFIGAGTLKSQSCCAPEKVEANQVKEISLVSWKTYANPYLQVELDAVVTRPDGKQLRAPAFWAGRNDWKFRYASELSGTHSRKTECKNATNTGHR